jgi:hypothetical protein
MQVRVPEQQVDALDAVLGERRAAEVAPEVRQRQLRAEDQRLDDGDDGGRSGRVRGRAGPTQLPVRQRLDGAGVHAVLL